MFGPIEVDYYLIIHLKLCAMKCKLLTIATAMLLFASCTTTRTSTSDNQAFIVPANIQSSFSTLYPDATNITWSNYATVPVPIDWEMAGWEVMEADDYVVQFDMAGERYYTWYDADGDLIGTVALVTDHTNLPTAVSNVLNTQYAGYVIEDIEREIFKDKLAYEIEIKKNDDDQWKLLIDSNGTILKSKKKD